MRLVRKNADKQIYLFIPEICADAFDRRADALRIVSAVIKHNGFVRYLFKPRLPNGGGESVFDRRFGNFKTVLSQNVNRCQHRCRVGRLIKPEQANKIFFAVKFKFRSVKRCRKYFEQIGIFDRQFRMLLFALVFYDVERFFIVAAVKRGTVFFDYTRLFPCDFFYRVAEDFGVIERYARYDGKQAVFYHVGRIVSAAQPDFKHNYVALCLIKPQKCRGGDEIERRRRRFHRVRLLSYPQKKVVYVVLRYRKSVYPYAVVENDDVRRRVKPDFIPLLLKNGTHHRAKRTFAVRARNMDKSQFVLRIAEQRKQLFFAICAEA